MQGLNCKRFQIESDQVLYFVRIWKNSIVEEQDQIMNLHFSRKKRFKDLKLTLKNLKNTNSIVEILLAITIDIATYMSH